MSKDSTKQILRELKKLRKELGGRLDHLESRIDDISGSSTGTSQRFDSPPISQGLKSNGATSRQSFTGPTERDVTVKIQPLTDLGMARVVESALADTEGVENASLRELRGDINGARTLMAQALDFAPAAAIGEDYTFRVRDGRIVRIDDPQGVLGDVRVADARCTARVKGQAGWHTFFVLAASGEVRAWLPVDVELPDRADHRLGKDLSHIGQQETHGREHPRRGRDQHGRDPRQPRELTPMYGTRPAERHQRQLTWVHTARHAHDAQCTQHVFINDPNNPLGRLLDS